MSVNGFARFCKTGMDVISVEQRGMSEKPAWNKAFRDACFSSISKSPIEMHDLGLVLSSVRQRRTVFLPGTAGILPAFFHQHTGTSSTVCLGD